MRDLNVFEIAYISAGNNEMVHSEIVLHPGILGAVLGFFVGGTVGHILCCAVEMSGYCSGTKLMIPYLIVSSISGAVIGATIAIERSLIL